MQNEKINKLQSIWNIFVHVLNTYPISARHICPFGAPSPPSVSQRHQSVPKGGSSTPMFPRCEFTTKDGVKPACLSLIYNPTTTRDRRSIALYQQFQQYRKLEVIPLWPYRTVSSAFSRIDFKTIYYITLDFHALIKQDDQYFFCRIKFIDFVRHLLYEEEGNII